LKVRFRGLAKKAAHVITLFALSNLWRAFRTYCDDRASEPVAARMQNAMSSNREKTTDSGVL
jgi:hypothetical protein